MSESKTTTVLPDKNYHDYRWKNKNLYRHYGDHEWYVKQLDIVSIHGPYEDDWSKINVAFIPADVLHAAATNPDLVKAAPHPVRGAQ